MVFVHGKHSILQPSVKDMSTPVHSSEAIKSLDQESDMLCLSPGDILLTPYREGHLGKG